MGARPVSWSVTVGPWGAKVTVFERRGKAYLWMRHKHPDRSAAVWRSLRHADRDRAVEQALERSRELGALGLFRRR